MFSEAVLRKCESALHSSIASSEKLVKLCVLSSHDLPDQTQYPLLHKHLAQLKAECEAHEKEHLYCADYERAKKKQRVLELDYDMAGECTRLDRWHESIPETEQKIKDLEAELAAMEAAI